MFSEKPNLNATMGFVIFYPFQFYPLKNIYNQFRDRAEFIIDCGQPGSLFNEEHLQRMTNLLISKNVFFRILSQEKYDDSYYLRNFFDKYKALLALNFHRSLWLDCNKDKIKIRAEYCAGKELVQFHPSLSKFDLILAYGKRQYDLFKFYTNCEIVGNPRFDDWFNNKFDQEFISETKKKLDPNKKTILYLPTHREFSSIDALAKPLVKLSREYNIIVKIHYITAIEEPEKMKKFKNERIIVFDDTIDTLPLFKICDAVLSDNSGAMAEALLIGKPLVAADFWGEEFLDIEHRSKFFYKNRARHPSTYSGSLEQQIKKEMAVKFKKPEELESAVKQALNSPSIFERKRNEIIREIYSFNDGNCSKRAKIAIEKALNDGLLKEKPILYHIFDTYCTWDNRQKLINVEKIKNLSLLRRINFILKEFF
jgi:hypothetical protein